MTRPILFSAPMVRALLDGRKTQTRRLAGLVDVNESPSAWSLHNVGPLGYMTKPSSKGKFGATFESRQIEPGTLMICPQSLPYAVGDHLWVREAWSGEHWLADVKPSDRLLVGNPSRLVSMIPETWYWADGSPEYGDWEKPRPSIHMPRWASRLTLGVTDVRVQRLQGISEEDARAEGVRGNAGNAWGCEGLIEDFADLWNSIHGPDAWDANPWVCALTFTVHRCNVDQMEDAS